MLLVLAPKFTLIGLTHVSWYDSSICLLSSKVKSKTWLTSLFHYWFPLIIIIMPLQWVATYLLTPTFWVGSPLTRVQTVSKFFWLYVSHSTKNLNTKTSEQTHYSPWNLRSYFLEFSTLDSSNDLRLNKWYGWLVATALQILKGRYKFIIVVE